MCNFGIHSLWEGRSIKAAESLVGVPDDEFRLWFRGCDSFVTPLHRKHIIVLFAALVRSFVSDARYCAPFEVVIIGAVPGMCDAYPEIMLSFETRASSTSGGNDTSHGQRHLGNVFVALRVGFLLGRSNRTTGME